MFLQATQPDVVFVSPFFKRQVAQLHGFHDSVDDKRASQAGPETEKQHLSAFVASERLHRSIVNNFHWAAKRCLEVETKPTFAQIMRLGNRPTMKHGAGVADGNDVVFPIRRQLLYAIGRLRWGEV